VSLYELLLLGHILAAVAWIGAGLSLVVLGLLAERASDDEGLRSTLDHTNRLSTVYFIPSSLLVVVFGIALVVESDVWSFDQLWIVLGLLGYAATFLTGLLVIKPRGERIGRMLGESGGRMTPAALFEGRKLLTLARIDYIVLFLVIADMVLKPTGDDAGLLAAMAAILVVGTAYVVWQVRSLTAPATA
jgi:uncharacterized membrane protein